MYSKVKEGTDVLKLMIEVKNDSYNTRIIQVCVGGVEEEEGGGGGGGRRGEEKKLGVELVEEEGGSATKKRDTLSFKLKGRGGGSGEQSGCWGIWWWWMGERGEGLGLTGARVGTRI